MDKIIVRKVNEVFLKLQTTKSIEMDLYNYFAEFAENYIFHPKVKMGFWDGRIRAYDRPNSLLPTGLLPKLSKYCKLNQIEIEYDFDVSEMFGEITDDDLYDFYDEIFPNEIGIYPRDYQHNAIYKALLNKRGITEACVGAGKSIMIYTISRMLLKADKNIILIVPNISLVEQMYSDFVEYGWDSIDDYVCKLHNNIKKPDLSKKFLITTYQSVVNKKPQMFDKYDALVIDECLSGDTKITTPNGLVEIKNISVGDIVYSVDNDNNIIEDVVVETFKNMKKSSLENMVRVTLEDGTFVNITGNHKVLTDSGWKRADELSVNDDILTIGDLC
jgi:hypothetical protein